METDNMIELMISGFEQNGKDLLEDVKRLPMVEKHTTASDYLISKKGLYLQDNVEWDGKTEAQKEVKIAQLELQENGWDMFRFRLIEGRGFEESDWQPSGNQPKDPITGKPVLNRIVVNESAVTAMQMEQPVGKRIRISTGIYICMTINNQRKYILDNILYCNSKSFGGFQLKRIIFSYKVIF